MRSSRSKPVVDCEILGILLKNIIMLQFKDFEKILRNVGKIDYGRFVDCLFLDEFGKTPRTAMLITCLNCVFPFKFES